MDSVLFWNKCYHKIETNCLGILSKTKEHLIVKILIGMLQWKFWNNSGLKETGFYFSLRLSSGQKQSKLNMVDS